MICRADGIHGQVYKIREKWNLLRNSMPSEGKIRFPNMLFEKGDPRGGLYLLIAARKSAWCKKTTSAIP